MFGRGLDVGAGADDDIALSRAGRERVQAALAHVGRHAEVFAARQRAGRRGRIVFSGGWPGAAEGLPAPPERRREGRLMLDLATTTGVNGGALDDHVDAFAEVESDSTLENALRVREGGWFADRTFDADQPLGLVAHAEHLHRIEYFTLKAFRLPRHAVQHVVAAGPDGTSGGRSETTLYRLTRLACLGAVTPAGLRRRERLLRAGFRLADRRRGHS